MEIIERILCVVILAEIIIGIGIYREIRKMRMHKKIIIDTINSATLHLEEYPYYVESEEYKIEDVIAAKKVGKVWKFCTHKGIHKVQIGTNKSEFVEYK